CSSMAASVKRGVCSGRGEARSRSPEPTGSAAGAARANGPPARREKSYDPRLSENTNAAGERRRSLAALERTREDWRLLAYERRAPRPTPARAAPPERAVKRSSAQGRRGALEAVGAV